MSDQPKKESRLAKYGPRILANGYDPVPIRHGLKHPGFKGWQKSVATPEVISEWDAKFARAGVGVLAARTPGVDIDVRDEAVGTEIRQFVEMMFGETLVRVGDAPKCLLVFQTDTPFAKVDTRMWIDAAGVEHKVEILGDGQQWVAYHMHPERQKPYKWDDKGPASTPRKLLPKLTEKQAVEIHDFAISCFKKAGWKLKQSGTALARLETSDDIDPDDIALIKTGVTDLSLDEMKQRLDLIDWENQGYEEWFACGMAIHHQFRDDPETGLALWHDYSSRYPDYSEKFAQDRWDSFHSSDSGRAKTFKYILELTKEKWKAIRPPLAKEDKSAFSRAMRVALALIGENAEATEDDYRTALEAEEKTRAWAAQEKNAETIVRCWGRAQDMVIAKPWLPKLLVGQQGNIISCVNNAVVVLQLDPAWEGVLAYDEMARKKVKRKSLPVFGVDELSDAYVEPVEYPMGERWTDLDTTKVRIYLENAGVVVSADTARVAIDMACMANSYHPIRSQLLSLKWDGRPRLDTWLHRYLGAPDRRYEQGVGRMFLISMIARIMVPGCKADHMVVFEGKQGKGKSTACEILAGGPAYFSDNMPDIGSDAVRVSMHLRGKWLIEIAELDAFRAAEAETLKKFITVKVEIYTPKHAREEVEEPRECVIAGTTNQDSGYIKDDTGARRLWPVATGHIDLAALARDRDQLMAEAMAAFKTGEQWHPTAEFQEQHAGKEQDARQERNDLAEAVTAWLRRRRADGITTTELTGAEVWTGALNGNLAQFARKQQMDVAKLLKQMGWLPTRTETRRFYLPPPGGIDYGPDDPNEVDYLDDDPAAGL